MLSGEFQQKLYKLNSKLRIFCKDDDSKPAGIFHIVNGEYEEICGIDKNEVPEFTIWDNKGHIIKTGWRRVMNLLIIRKYINKKQAEDLFHCYWFNKNTRGYIEESNISKLSKQEQIHKDDLANIGSKL